MSDIEKYISERKAKSPKMWADFDVQYRHYAIGLLLAEHRQKAGLSLTTLARRMKMQKSALSRLENHGEDVRLSTIARYVQATGQPMVFKIYPKGSKPGKGAASLTMQLEPA